MKRLFAALRESVVGTFETWLVWLTMSASGGKAEVAFWGHQVRV